MTTSIRGNRVIPFKVDTMIGGIESRPEGEPFEFFYGGRKHTWTRYRSDGRMRHIGSTAPAQLVGSYARALLGDALGQTMLEAMARQRLHETDAERAERLARVNRREALRAADREAHARPARTRDW